MKLSEKQAKFSCMVARFLSGICVLSGVTGMSVTLGEVWRTNYQQKHNVEMGLSELSTSKHCDRLAIDLNLFIKGKYVTDAKKYLSLGLFWESLGGRWGGRFGVKKEDYETKIGWDSNHFEYKD